MKADIQSYRLSTENWEQSPVPTSFNTQRVASLHYCSFKNKWQHPCSLQRMLQHALKLSLGEMDICTFKGTLASQKQVCVLVYLRT